VTIRGEFLVFDWDNSLPRARSLLDSDLLLVSPRQLVSVNRYIATVSAICATYMDCRPRQRQQQPTKGLTIKLAIGITL
jgi:hypothetical protein